MRTVSNLSDRAGRRSQLRIVNRLDRVDDHELRRQRHPSIRSVQVAPGFDIADNLIAQEAQPGDLVVTQDIPLAAEVVEKKVEAINNRGEVYKPETIRQKLNMRDFMESMRSSGIQTGGPAAFSDRDKQAFANALDRWLARQ